VLKKIMDGLKKAAKAGESGDHAKAAEWLLKVISYDPEHHVLVPRAKLDLAKSYRQLKQYRDARGAVEEVLARDEGNVEAHILLGQVLVDMEDFEAAVHQVRLVGRIT
jgi:lipopolysaccharide biosynthesis regulator YciM